MNSKANIMSQTHSTFMRILTSVAFAITATFSGYGQRASSVDQLPASSSAAADEVVSLPAFSVTAPLMNQYQSAEAVSAARTAGKILDIAMTINVITPALIHDVGPGTMFNLTQYFAGVSSGRGTGSGGIDDRQTFRGFESFSRTVDNFSGFMFPQATAPNANGDPVFVEHVELLMGPDAILAPTGTPGGSLNLITKSPLFTQGTDISAQVGHYDANKYTFDSTGPLGSGQHMAYRVIASYQDSKTFLPGANLIFCGSAQFTYRFSDTAKLIVKYFGQQTTFKGTATLCNLDGEQIYTPDTVGGVTLSNTPQPGFEYQGWNGDPSWSYRIARNNTVQAELNAAIGERVNMRLAAQVFYDKTNLMVGFPSPTFTEKWDQVTGQQISVTPINPSALPESTTWQQWKTRQTQIQNDFAGKFEAGGVSLQPLVGWSYQQGSFPYYYALQKRDMPLANLAVMYNPPIPTYSQFTNVNSNTPSNGWLFQAYTFLRVGLLSDRLFLTAGAERTSANVNDYVFPGIYLPSIGQVGSTAPGVNHTFSNTGNAVMPSVKSSHDSYIAGLLYKVLPNVSAYYSFSTNASVTYNVPLWQAGKQHEFGIKSDFFNKRLSVNVDHFQISESNVQAANPLFNIGQSKIQFLYTDLTNHGFEVNVVGGITKDLSVIMSYTNMHLRDFVGRRQRNIPDNLATLLLNYRFSKGALKNANVFAGVIHQGDVAGETVTGFTTLGVAQQVGFYVAAYNVVNAGAGYEFGRYKFNLNVDNALNDKFWWQASSRTSLSPYPTINVRTTVTVHF